MCQAKFHVSVQQFWTSQTTRSFCIHPRDVIFATRRFLPFPLLTALPVSCASIPSFLTPAEHASTEHTLFSLICVFFICICLCALCWCVLCRFMCVCVHWWMPGHLRTCATKILNVADFGCVSHGLESIPVLQVLSFPPVQTFKSPPL